MSILYQIVNMGSPQWQECPEDLKKYGVDEWCQRILEVYDIVTGK